MDRLIGFFLAAAIALYPSFPRAESAQTGVLSGVEDPRLQRAIDAYLDGEALGPINEFAALARDGNIAAKFLLWRLEYRRYDDLPELSREERWRLYRAPSSKGRPRPWVHSEEFRDHPIRANWGRVREEPDPVAWLGFARRMIAAGEREHVLRSGLRFLTTHPFVAEFLDEVTTANDYHQSGIWMMRWLAHRLAEMQAGSAPEYWTKGWTGPPWGSEQEEIFRQSFRDKRLAALMLQSARNGWAGTTSPGDLILDRTYDRLVAVLHWLRHGTPTMPPPKPSERIAAGALLVAEARHGTYLTPLLRICEMRCEMAVEACMYSGFVHTGGAFSLAQFISPLESVISESRWLESFRARQEVLRQARLRLDVWALERARGAMALMPPGGCFAQLLVD